MREDWIISTIGELCDVNLGQSPPSSTYNKDGNGIPFFQGKAEFTELYPIVEKWCTSPKKTAKKGDILLSVRAPVGATNIANIDCAIGRGLAALRFHLNNKYLWFYLKKIEKELDDIGTGTTFNAISGKDLKSFSFPLAPLPEQRAIVAKIEQLFSELDNGIANLQAAKDKLEIYRQAVLKKAFEGELIQQSPKIKLSKITTKIGSGATPKGGKQNYKTHGTPLIRSMNIHFDFIKYDELAYIDEKQAKKLNNVIVEINDVLLNITGASIGRVNIAPKEFAGGRVNQHVSIIRLTPEYDSKFLKYLLQSPSTQNWINNANYGVTRQALTKGMIENFELPNLKKENQLEIVEKIESQLSVCDNVLNNIQEALEKSESLRQSILKKAFEGRLLREKELEACKKEQDWEPAEVLLERIKKETKVNP